MNNEQEFRKRMESAFPNLVGTGYEKTSDRDPSYNCIAWAAGEQGRWWEPNIPDVGYFWPPEAPDDDAIDSLIVAYTTVGFEPCEDGVAEPGYEKVAIYADRTLAYQHAARGLPTGGWTSKIGKAEDMRHENPDHLNGGLYGTVHSYLRRRRTDEQSKK